MSAQSGRVSLAAADVVNVASSLTLAAGGKREPVRVFVTHPVNHVYLLQGLSYGIFVLGVTGNKGCPELKGRQKVTYQHD